MNTQQLKELALDITEQIFDTGAADNEATKNALAFVVSKLKPVFEHLEAAERERDELRNTLAATQDGAAEAIKHAVHLQTELDEYSESERLTAVKSVELQDEIYGLKAEIARRDAVMNERTGEWAIDMSCGRPILVCKGCSVIEEKDAEYVLSLIERDAVAGERVKAVVKHYAGCKYPLLKVNSLEVVIAGEREDAEDLAEFINTIGAQPAVLPPEMTFERALEECRHIPGAIANSFRVGANWMRSQVIEMGAQPQMVVELPEYLCMDSNDCGPDLLVVEVKMLTARLDAANVKWVAK